VPGGQWNSRAPEGAWAESQRGELTTVLRSLNAAGVVLASVCAGAMILASAGVMTGRPAITHHSAIKELSSSRARVVRARVADDGTLITADGVTSGLDLALWLVEC